MKRIKRTARRLGVFLLTFCMAAAMLPCSAFAADDGGRYYVRFTNAPLVAEDQHGLLVSKTLSNASSVPEEKRGTEFTFCLELDGDPARNREYLYFNSNGQQLYRYNDKNDERADKDGYYITTKKEKNKTEVGFFTDVDGFFTLKAGEFALFIDLDGGTEYSIVEYPADGYAAVSPAAETPLTGTLNNKGDGTAAFTNRYLVPTPIDPPGPPTPGQTGPLYVRKEIAWPSAYQFADDTAFPMVLTVDGSPWAEKNYTVMDEYNNIDSTGTSGSDGSFSIKKGQTAIFEGIPVDTEFTLSELMPGGWWAQGVDLEKNGSLISSTGSTITEATALSGRTIVTFTNASASFVVTKSLAEGALDVGKAFTFTLKHGDGSVWQYAEYWLYNADGSPDDSQYNAAANGGKGGWEALSTDANGQFALKPGQRALFVGIEPGTAYKVSESAAEHYTQILPESTEGYAKKVQSSVETLPFVNTKVPDEYGVLVSKNLVNKTNAAVPEVSFRFRISRCEENELSSGSEDVEITESTEETEQEEKNYIPWANAVYDIINGSGTESYMTDENGEFTLKAEQTAGFRYVIEGMTYKVEEIGVVPEILNERFSVESESSYQGTYIIDDGALSFAFVNSFDDADVDWGFYKVDALDSTKFLQYAKFRLIRGIYSGGEYIWPESDENATLLVSDENGYVDVGKLSAGVYKLVETGAPYSYFLPNGYWIITVDLLSEEPVSVQAMDTAPDFKTVALGDNEVIAVANTGSFAMPHTGGNVLMLYVMGGLMLAAAAVLIVTGRRKSSGSKQI